MVYSKRKIAHIGSRIELNLPRKGLEAGNEFGAVVRLKSLCLLWRADAEGEGRSLGPVLPEMNW